MPPKKSTKSRGKQPAAPPATPAQGPAAAGAAGAPGVPTTPAPAPAPPVAPHGDAPTGSAHLPAQPGTGGPQINVIPAFVPDPTRLAHPQLTEALAEANRRSIDEYKSFLSTSVKDALKTKFARAAFQAVGPLDVLYRWLRSVPNPRGAFLDFVDNLEAARLLDSDDLKGAKGLKELMEKDPKDPLHTKFTKKVFQAAIARQMNVQAAPAPAATAQAGPAAAEPQREVAASVVTRPLAALKPLTDKDAKSLFGESAPTFLEPAVDAAKQRSVRVPIATAFFKWAARGASIPSVEGASGPTWSEFREVMEERRRTWSEAGMTFGEGLYHRFLDAMRAEGFDAKSGHLDELRRFLTIAKDEGTGRDKTKSEFEFLLENEELESGVTITSGFVRKLNDLLQDDGSAGAQVGQEQTLPLAKTISDLIESVVSNDDGVRTDLIFCLDFAYSKDLTTLLEHFQRERIEGIRKRVVSSTRNGKVRPAVLERLKEGSQVDRHLRRYIKQHATAAAQSTTRRERGTRRQAVGFQVRESHAYFRLAPGTSSIQTHESRKSDRELQVAEGRRTSRRQPEPRAVHSAMSSAPGSRGHSPKRRRVASGGPEYLVTDDGSSPGRMLMEAEQTAQPARPDSGLLEQAERRFRREGAAVENDLNYNAPAAPPGHVLVLTPADLLERGFGVRDPALIKDYRTNLAAWRFLERSGGTTSRRPTKKEPSWTVSEDFDERFQMQMLYGSKDSFAHGILRLAVPRFATPEDKEKKEAEVAASWTTGCEAEVMEACGKPWEDLKQGTREWMKALEIKRRFKKLKDKALKELIDEDAKFRRRVLFEFRADSRRTAVPRDKRRASAGRAPAAPPPPDPAPLQRKRGRAPAPPPAAAPQAPSTAALSPPPVPPVDPRRPAAPVHNSNATPVVQPEPTGYGDFQSLHQLFFACDRALEHAIQEGPAADRAALEEERKALGTAVDLLRMRVPARAFHSLSVFADVCSRPVDTQEQVFNVCSVGGRALDAVLRAFNLLKFQPGVNFGNRVVLDESSICAYCDGPIKEVVAACKHHSPANLEMIKARHMAGHFSAYANKDAPQQVVDFPSLLRQIAERDGLQAVESFVLRNHAQNGIGCGSLGKVVPALWSGKHFIDGVRNALEIGATWIDPFWRQLIESDPRAVPSPPGSSSAAPSHPPARAAPPSTPAPKPHPSTNAPPLTKEAAALPPRPSCVVCGGAPGKCKSDCDPQLRAYFDQIADAWDPERKRHFRVSTEFLTRPAKNLISSLLPHIRALLQRAIADHSFQRRLRQELPGFIHLGLDMWLKENEHGSFVVDDASMYYLARLLGTRNSEREPFKPNTADKGLDAARVRVTEFFRRKVLPRFLKLIKETELMGSFWGADVVDSTGQSISSQILVSYCNQLKSIDRPLGKLIRGRFVDAGMPSGLVGRLAQRALAVLFDNVPAELMVGTDFIEAIAAPSDAAGDASTDDKDSDEANLAAELEQVKEEDGVGKDDGHKAGEREQKLFQTVLRECLDIMRLLPQDSRDLLGHLHSEKRFPPRPELGWELWRRKESEKGVVVPVNEAKEAFNKLPDPVKKPFVDVFERNNALWLEQVDLMARGRQRKCPEYEDAPPEYKDLSGRPIAASWIPYQKKEAKGPRDPKTVPVDLQTIATYVAGLRDGNFAQAPEEQKKKSKAFTTSSGDKAWTNDPKIITPIAKAHQVVLSKIEEINRTRIEARKKFDEDEKAVARASAPPDAVASEHAAEGTEADVDMDAAAEDKDALASAAEAAAPDVNPSTGTRYPGDGRSSQLNPAYKQAGKAVLKAVVAAAVEGKGTGAHGQVPPPRQNDLDADAGRGVPAKPAPKPAAQPSSSGRRAPPRPIKVVDLGMTYSTYAKSFETFGKDAIIRLLQSVEGSPITGITNKSFESTLFGNGYATFAAHIWDLSDFAPELAGRGPELWTFHSALTNGESVNYVFEKHVLKEVDDKGRPIGARRPASTKAEKEKRAEEAEKKKWEDYKKFLDEGVKLAQLDELLALIIPSNDPGERNLLCGTRNLNKPQFRVVKNACDKPPVNPKTGEVIDVAPLLQKVYVRNEDGTCTTWVKSCRRDPITGMLTGIELREEVTLADKADKAEKYWQEHGVNPDQLEGLKKLKPHRPAENQEPKDTYGSTWQSMRGPRPPKRSDDSVGRPRSANVDDSFSRRKWSDNELVLEWLLWTKRNYRCLPHDWDEAEHGPMAQRGREERARAKAEREKERAQRQQAESAGAADTGSDLEGAEAMDTASEAGSASGSAGSGGGDAGGAELENVMADAGGDDAQDEGAMAAEFEGDVDEQLEAGHEAAEEELDSDYESDASSSSSSGSSEYKPAAARKPKRAPSKPAKEASKSSRKAKASKRSLVFIDEDEEEPEIPQQEMQRNKEMWLALGMLPRKNAFRAEAIYSLSKQEHRRQCGFIEYQRESDKFKKAHKLPHCYVVDHEEVEKRKRGESDRTDLPIKKLEGEMTLKEWESGLPTKRTTDPDKLVLFLACHLNTQLPVYEFYKRHQLTDLKRRVTARAAATVDRFVEEFVSPFWMRVPIERARKLDGICKNKKIKIEMMFPDASRFSDPPYLGRRRKKKPPDKDDAKKQEEADKEVLRKAKEGEVFIRMFVAPTLVDGDAVWPHTIRGSTHAPTLRYAAAFDRLHARWNLPGSERRMLKAPMKEYHTSACCSSCLETRLRMAASRFVERRKLIWGVKKCIRCHIMWNRDVNAGRNMVHLFVFGCLTGGMRPPAFRVGY